jgi:hypothetical protein
VTASRLPWRLVSHPGPKPLVVCWRCEARILNETNAMRRQGWEQVRWGRSWVFRCHTCSAREGRGSDGPSFDGVDPAPAPHTHITGERA